MYYQKCPNCLSDWNSVKTVCECPFCNTALVIETNQFNGIFDNINDALAYIFSVYGFDIIFEGDRLVNLLADCAPTLVNERRLIKTALTAGIYADLLNSNPDFEVGRSVQRAKAVECLKSSCFIDPYWSGKVVDWFVNQLGWETDAGGMGIADTHKTGQLTEAASNEPKRGDVVTFGRYPYSEDGTPAKIEWEIIGIENDKALLLSVKCLESFSYNRSKSVCTWKDCDLRMWLRDTFLKRAFSDSERASIVQRRNKASYNPKSKRSSGTDTTDKIFILSNEQLSMYSVAASCLISEATPYAKKRKMFCDPQTKRANWWLRTPGSDDKTEMFVSSKGRRDEQGSNVDNTSYGVRPAVWVKIDSLKR